MTSVSFAYRVLGPMGLLPALLPSCVFSEKQEKEPWQREILGCADPFLKSALFRDGVALSFGVILSSDQG